MTSPYRPPERGVQDLRAFPQRLRGWRLFYAIVGGVGVLIAACGVPSGVGSTRLLLPLSFIVFGLPGVVLLLVSQSRAIAAMDASSWTVSQPGLSGARNYSWAAGLVMLAGVFALLAATLIQSTLSLHLLLVLPLGLIMAMGSVGAGSFGRDYHRLARWHREAPPELLRTLPPEFSLYVGRPMFW
ncbi:hypothetical protein GCM10027290_12630 [Micromonospora sonneratiae]|uniref:Uncharacterized protein n=1 Tax=Micromonospora sonneratiae TaxID=1184706 RepID=A0ABW3YKP4_9ACTN